MIFIHYKDRKKSKTLAIHEWKIFLDGFASPQNRNMAGITPIEQYVIDKVRKMREDAGLSQVDIAVFLDTSEGVIGDIESTKRNAKYSIRHLNDLAKGFKCSPRDFLPEYPLE